jgi:NADPH:quinone reductase-like Zn-dependent oxidoreductase
MKAVRFARFGRASEVAELIDIPEPGLPGPGQVLFELEVAPINPSDLLNFAGRYGTPPALPSFAGGGVFGRVLACAQDVCNVAVGDRVIVINTERSGWRERFICPADGLLPLPEADPVALALLAANPPTALLMLELFGDLQPGDWVIQNSANSSVGVSLIQIARARGLKTVNVVRRGGLDEALAGFGSHVTLVDGPDLKARVVRATEGASIKLAIDAVAGDATRRLASCVADGGVVVNYGLLSGKPCEADSADILFRDVTLRGFWYSKWRSRAGADEVKELFARLVDMLKAGTLRVPVEAVYPVARLGEALAHAEREGRLGKVVLRWADA